MIKNRLRKQWIKAYESFKETSIPEILKKISNVIRIDLLNNGNNCFQKTYKIDYLYFKIIVNFTPTKIKEPYYSNVNIDDIIRDNVPINIPIEVKDISIGVDYLLSIIIHEIRHIYDVYTINSDNDMKSFIQSINLPKFKNTKYEFFTDLIYLSLEHELLARHNMIYPMFRWINITDKNKLIEIYKKTYIHESLEKLKNFDHVKFIKLFDKKSLLSITNTFIKDVVKENNFCENENDLLNFYSKYEGFFKEKSEEFSSYVDEMLNDIINDIKNNKIYEHYKTPSYHENNINGVLKLLQTSYKRIFNII